MEGEQHGKRTGITDRDRRDAGIRFDCEESEDLTQTATIIGTLVNEVGLRVPTSFIYKKFSIPEPEADEEVAAPRSTSAGLTGLPFKKEPNPAQIALKAEGDGGVGTQQHIDKLASAAVRHGAGMKGSTRCKPTTSSAPTSKRHIT